MSDGVGFPPVIPHANKVNAVFSFYNLPLTLTVALIIWSWISFFSVIIAG